jgi:hypothetical protein
MRSFRAARLSVVFPGVGFGAGRRAFGNRRIRRRLRPAGRDPTPFAKPSIVILFEDADATLAKFNNWRAFAIGDKPVIVAKRNAGALGGLLLAQHGVSFR